MKMADAKQKRNEQLKRWIGSETDLEPPVVKRQKTKVKFDDGAVFLAACSSGDTDEVLKLLHRGADINYANVDGLTALHQACIDDNVDMVKFLVENGANINQPDNEGWIPLHAAASCGYLDIAEFLIGQGAHVGAVNSEGDTPLDIAEEEAMEELLQNEVNRQGVDIEAARKEEERVMLRDARQWLNSGHISDVRHAKSGGTALHVAAAKGYTEVLKLLIQAGYDVNIKDYDGWTPLHAAAHWGKEEACRILVDNLCDMETVNKVGQTAFDVADEDILGYLEELQKKQTLLHSEKRDKKSPLIESTANMENNQPQKAFKNKETLIIEPEKNASRIESLEHEKADEEEEGKKDESSCSSEEDEEDDSESEAETDKTKPMASVSNAHTSSTQAAPAAVTAPTLSSNQGTPTSPVKKFPISTTKISPKEEERKDESPASWRLGLRKTGSYGALAEISASKEAQKEKDTAGVMRSASSPRLSSSLDNKEKEKDNKGTRLAYVTPTIPRRLASTSDIEEKENRESSSLRTSSSYTRRKWEDDLKKNSSINEGSTYHRSCSFGRRQDDLISCSVPSTTSTPTVTSAAGLQRSLPSSTSTAAKTPPGSSSAGTQSSTSNRLWAEDSTEKEKDSAPTAVTIPVAPTVVNAAAPSTTTLTTTTAGTVSEVRERRRSYLTPVRDEESESQRKARSRQARQSRRSTQGVTLTDLQEAEKTIGRSRSTRTREQENEEKEKEEKEKQDKEKQEEKKESEASREDEYKQKYSRTYDETYTRYRPVSTSSSSAPSSSSLSTLGSTLYASSQLNRPNSLVGITSAYSRGLAKENEREGEKKEEEKEGEDKSQPKSIRERRRPREKRRSTGVSFWTQDSDENEQERQSDTEDGSSKRETQTDSVSRYDSSSTSSSDRYDSLLGRSASYSYLEDRKPYSSRLEKDDSTDFKKLYEQILAENEKLKAQLHDTNMELTDLKLQLEKATQRQERFADRSQLEMEKRERRALERRISEMEEELKMLPDLKADNQRLKDENGALIRVISKLSK
ncbi:protein phosphatase 1 regulatory subunit 12A isoform 1 [Mus musculus]|uniref:Protein phosphatase 1 regulatory subunit 12A n=1 Tax=Mus musculus TaxID=10090 RepID=MYPT1_MOUSE|nr:protein phosphatase 1 regulatory subunit 12A isoform 1 [Mus musculus]Q9DBR7.2 RecName: Full=Protein phosphatase 1 regulatory subunit 12A; AltName: Full=Myosin phosphatase-targeting subunit 1; Short=Myosin phosphatase target subunit 1 [Mus musculus]AAI25382.1 Ppp1r12a protein [Mus musculus]AAI37631.1 Ppp1r12a protein [Mus musculus]EDL21703.1 mCG122391, isoform CRA_e [Mus musculus]|eukprot:XP_006513389.1 PREDICTED: protein phosphatase 1 regulatory subunit 12A isoform X1 [Mus musculus]